MVDPPLDLDGGGLGKDFLYQGLQIRCRPGPAPDQGQGQEKGRQENAEQAGLPSPGGLPTQRSPPGIPGTALLGLVSRFSLGIPDGVPSQIPGKPPLSRGPAPGHQDPPQPHARDDGDEPEEEPAPKARRGLPLAEARAREGDGEAREEEPDHKEGPLPWRHGEASVPGPGPDGEEDHHEEDPLNEPEETGGEDLHGMPQEAGGRRGGVERRGQGGPKRTRAITLPLPSR